MCPFCGREKKRKEKRSKRGMEMDLNATVFSNLKFVLF
jgi:hypothetical protein